MNGRDYVIESMELVQRLVSEMKKEKVLDGDTVLDGVLKSCADLDKIKNKATLKTKVGTNKAYPVEEAAQNLEEAWEDAQGQEEIGELRERLEDFIVASTALISALKERTVIMT